MVLTDEALYMVRIQRPHDRQRRGDPPARRCRIRSQLVPDRARRHGRSGCAALPRRRRRQLRAPPRAPPRPASPIAFDGEISCSVPARAAPAPGRSGGRGRGSRSGGGSRPCARCRSPPPPPTRSPAQTRSPRRTARRPAHVGVEVAAVLAFAVDQQVVAVEDRVVAASAGPAVADRDQPASRRRRRCRSPRGCGRRSRGAPNSPIAPARPVRPLRPGRRGRSIRRRRRGWRSGPRPARRQRARDRTSGERSRARFSGVR